MVLAACSGGGDSGNDDDDISACRGDCGGPNDDDDTIEPDDDDDLVDDDDTVNPGCEIDTCPTGSHLDNPDSPDCACVANPDPCDEVECPVGKIPQRTGPGKCDCLPDIQPCEDAQHTCADGQCIESEEVCDGKDDCSDAGDEAECPPPPCDPPNFQCGSGECLDVAVVCDQTANCDDASDEAGCPVVCNDAQFDCGGECVGAGEVCDGFTDCANGSDEENCPAACEGEPIDLSKFTGTGFAFDCLWTDAVPLSDWGIHCPSNRPLGLRITPGDTGLLNILLAPLDGRLVQNYSVIPLGLSFDASANPCAEILDVPADYQALMGLPPLTEFRWSLRWLESGGRLESRISGLLDPSKWPNEVPTDLCQSQPHMCNRDGRLKVVLVARNAAAYPLLAITPNLPQDRCALEPTCNIAEPPTGDFSCLDTRSPDFPTGGTVSMSGQVLGLYNKGAVGGAKIRLQGGTTNITADEFGFFNITGLRSNTRLSMRVSATGHKPTWNYDVEVPGAAFTHDLLALEEGVYQLVDDVIGVTPLSSKCQIVGTATGCDGSPVVGHGITLSPMDCTSGTNVIFVDPDLLPAIPCPATANSWFFALNVVPGEFIAGVETVGSDILQWSPPLQCEAGTVGWLPLRIE